jgi:hypothetical protein
MQAGGNAAMTVAHWQDGQVQTAQPQRCESLVFNVFMSYSEVKY